jgi:hypothetical protein
MYKRMSGLMAVVVLATCGMPAIAAELPFGKGITAADRSLAMKLMEADAQETKPEKDLEIAKVDLNGDGHIDYVVLINNSFYCGSGGCAAGVFVADGSAYRRVADMLAFRVELGDGSTKGARDLVQVGRTGNARWLWDGHAYRQIPARK